MMASTRVTTTNSSVPSGKYEYHWRRCARGSAMGTLIPPRRARGRRSLNIDQTDLCDRRRHHDDDGGIQQDHVARFQKHDRDAHEYEDASQQITDRDDLPHAQTAVSQLVVKVAAVALHE